MADNLNFLRSVREEDFVEYFVFPPAACGDDKEAQSILKSYLGQIQSITEKYAKDYLWHRDEFKLVTRTLDCNLQVEEAQEENLPPHLYGISHYGDNIEDEWFIVFLLFQITKELEGLLVRVVDADGEFLLIEAANYLPKWARPEVCEKRVYIYNGAVHIVAPANIEDPSEEQSFVGEMIEQIRKNPAEYLAIDDIQNCLLNKIKGYPEQIKDNLHTASAYLPIGVATILRHKPDLVAPAVRAFCNRDTVDLRACRAMKYFPPENRVYARVTFTRCLYAMLAHSRYVPDKRTGWNMPAMNNPQYKAHSLGVKLACGFEILASQAKPSADIETDRGWHAYLERLKGRGYFKDLLEHSRAYNDLLNKAKEYYVSYRDSMHSAPVVGQEILDLAKSLDYSDEEIKFAELPPDDDDSWLNIDPRDLERMLEEQYGHKKCMGLNGNTDAATFTSKITEFLDQVSNIEGVEFPDVKNSPIRPPRGIKSKGKNKVSFSTDTKEEEKEEKSNSNKVSFDPAAFTCALQNILDFMIPEDDGWDLDSDSDMSAYGEETEANIKDNKVKNDMLEYMDQMDEELAKTAVGQSFQKIPKARGDGFEDVENFEPVDIDMNALKNVLESYQAQMGEAGPASNMLGPMGIHLEQEKDEMD